MPTQVRIFTSPRSLGETLAIPIQLSPAVPRSVPEVPEIPKSTVDLAFRARQHAAMSGPADQDDQPKGGVTYAHQDKLPKLPIPDLELTCQRYLKALKPLQSPREHAETTRAVREFLRNEGPELNEKLKKYAEARTSYIEQFCTSSRTI
jgi:carnitine O-acetyltransferase